MNTSFSLWLSAWQKAALREKIQTLLNLTFEAGIIIFLFLSPIPKTATLRAVGLGMAAFAWGGKMILGRRFSWRHTPLDWFWAAFLLVAILVSYFALIPAASWKFFRREFLLWAALYFLLVQSLENIAQIKRICVVLLLSLTAVSAVGAIEFFLGVAAWKGWRATSVLGTPGHAAYFAMMLLPLSLAAFFYFDKWYKKILLALPLAAGGGFLLMTLSRGAWLGAFAATLLIGVLKDRRFLIFLLTATVIGGMLVPRNLVTRRAFVNPHQENITAADVDTGFRLYVWKSALRMIKDRPLLGAGLGEDNFHSQYSKYMDPRVPFTHGYRNAHNFYLQVAVEMGILGFLAFFSLFLAAGWMMWKAYRTAKASGEQGLTGFLLGMLGAWVALCVYGLVSHRFEKEVAVYFWTYAATAVFVSQFWIRGQEKQL